MKPKPSPQALFTFLKAGVPASIAENMTFGEFMRAVDEERSKEGGAI